MATMYCNPNRGITQPTEEFRAELQAIDVDFTPVDEIDSLMRNMRRIYITDRQSWSKADHIINKPRKGTYRR